MKKKKVKVFLSLGFKGRSRDEVLDKIQKMKEYLNKPEPEDVEYDFYHNYYCSPPCEKLGVKNNSVYCLSEALKQLAGCDMMLLNFEDIHHYNGVDAELGIATKYNIPLMLYNENNYTVIEE